MYIERMFIYRPGYTKWYTLQTYLSNTQSSHKFVHEEETRVIENKDSDIISEGSEMDNRWTEYCMNFIITQ